jgi:hypothetical protein
MGWCSFFVNDLIADKLLLLEEIGELGKQIVRHALKTRDSIQEID